MASARYTFRPWDCTVRTTPRSSPWRGLRPARSVVVTKDEDFPKLLRQQRPPPQLVWVRSGNVTNQELRAILLENWPRAAELLARGETLVEIRRRHDPAS